MRPLGALPFIFVSLSFFAQANPGVSPVPEVVDRYLVANQAQQERLRGVSMEVSIDARLPRLHRSGRLQALRYISKIGQITYRALRFDGDNTVKKDVISRYLSAETQARASAASLAISPENYTFKYKTSLERNGRTFYIVELKPKKKRVGLFKGELWIDAETYLPLREAGILIRNPSVFLRKVEFVRDYLIRDGLALPSRVESKIDTRLVGRAELSISFTNFTRQAPEETAVASSGEVQ